MIPWLDAYDDATGFPEVESALLEPDGLLAAGGSLRPKRLLAAYRRGIFPWYGEGEPILWWCPSQRAVILPERIHVSRSLRRFMNRRPFEVTHNRAFRAVVEGCAEPRPGSGGTWITDDMKAAYCKLFQRGHGRSVECWQDGELVGGIYGVQMGTVFFGESMFSRVSNASKVALVTVARMADVDLIDCQLPNSHLATMGMVTVPRADFLKLLDMYCV